MVSNLRKNFSCIVWHQKPTVNAIQLYWGNTLVLGRMYRWILSSFWGIDGQYWLISGAKRRRRPVLHLNSEEWWQYSPIYLTQNYCIHIVIMSTFVHVSFYYCLPPTYFPIRRGYIVLKSILVPCTPLRIGKYVGG
jgi:hypothetical protein